MEKGDSIKAQKDEKAKQQKISVQETVQLQRAAIRTKSSSSNVKASKNNAKPPSVITNLLSRIVYTIRLMRSKKWYNYTYLSLTVLLVICMMLQSTDPTNKISNISKTVEYCCHFGFVLFVVIRLCSLEPIHIGWCAAECTAFVTGLSTILVTNEEIKPYLHAASCLRAVIIVRTTSLFIPFTSFVGAFKNVARVVLPAIVLIYQFSIIGYFVFSHTASNSLNPQQKIASYQNILYSFYNSYKMVFVVGWSQTSYYQHSQVNPIFIFVYYTIFIYLVSYIYMNIFYGTMMANQQDLIPEVKKVSLNILQQICVVEEQGGRKNSQTLRLSNNLNTHQNNQIDGSIKDLMQYLASKPELKKQLLMVVVKKPKPITDIFLFQEINSKLGQVYTQQKTIFLTKQFYLPQNLKIKSIVQKISKIYQRIDILIIVISCLNMCISSQNFNIEKFPRRNILDLFCTFWLFFNLLVKLFCHQIKQIKLTKWCEQNKVQIPISLLEFDFQLKFQLVIAMLAGAGIYHQIMIAQMLPILSYPKDKIGRLLRTIKYIRICKIFISENQVNSIKKAKLIIFSIIKIIKKLLPYFAFFMLMVILFSLIGYNLFNKGNQQSFDYQFSSVFHSFIYVFMIFNNQGHNQILSQQYPIHGILIIIYHIIALTIGNAILIKYFMTLFLTQLLQELQHKDGQINQQASAKTIDNKVMPNQIQIQCDKSQLNSRQKQISNTKGYENQCQQIAVQSQSFVSKLKQKGRTFLNSYQYLAFHFLITVICVVQAAYRGPLLDRNSELYLAFQKVSSICSIYFLIQLSFNLFCFGLFGNQQSYLKQNKTGIIAILIAIICLLCLIPSLGEMEIVFKLCKLKILRMFITLQLAANKCYRMKLTIIGFIRLFPKMIMFLAMVAVYYGFCAVVLVSLYQQQAYQCVNYAPNATVDSIKDCLHWGGDWVQIALSSNQTLMTLLNLVTVSLMESWSDFISNISQIRGYNLQPQTNANSEMYILAIYGYLSGSFLILNLFSGLLLYHMKKIMQQESGQCKLDKFQINWLCIREEINRIELVPKNQFLRFSLRYYLNAISNAQVYRICKICYIISLLVFLSLPNFPYYDKYFYNIYATYFFTSLIFTVIQRLGEKNKVKISIIIFDIILYTYAFAYFSYVLTKIESQQQKNVLIVGAILTAMQLLHYWQYFIQFEMVKKTLKYLFIILPRALFILIPMLIIFIVYTFVALQLFPYLKLSDSKQANIFSYSYSTFFQAFQSLMRFATESQINQIIDASRSLSPSSICFQMRNYGDYLKYGANGCGSKVISFLFFLSFHIIYSLIMSSALMANIFDSYIQVKKREYIVMNQFQLQKVTHQWLKFDSKATGFLPIHSFWFFTTRLYQIYGLTQKRNITFQFKYQFLKNLNLCLYKNNQTLVFQFYETVQELTKLLLCKKHRKPFTRNNADQIFEKINDSQNHTTKQILKTNFTSKDVIALITLKQGLNKWHDKIFQRKRFPATNYTKLYKKFCNENLQSSIKKQQNIQK